MADRHIQKRRMLALNPEEDHKLETFRAKLEKKFGMKVQRQQAIAKALDLALGEMNGRAGIRTYPASLCAVMASGFGQEAIA